MTTPAWEQPPERPPTPAIMLEGVDFRQDFYTGDWIFKFTVGGRYTSLEQAQEAALDYLKRMNLR